MQYIEDHDRDITGIHACPVCNKIFFEEKAMYLHIMRAHRDNEQLAYDLRADLYQRWQKRMPRVSQ